MQYLLPPSWNVISPILPPSIEDKLSIDTISPKEDTSREKDCKRRNIMYANIEKTEISAFQTFRDKYF